MGAKREVIILKALLVSIFIWIAVWGLAEQGMEYLEREYKIKKGYLLAGILGVVAIVIAVDPDVFEHL